MYDTKKFDRAAARLVANHQTVAVAESVTAGLIQNAFANANTAISFFEGGITAYTINQKCTHLFIDPTHAIECNCVSERVAMEMALGVSRSFNTDWGIAITGYASPVPELNIDKLHAWYVLSFAGKVVLSEIIYPPQKSTDHVQNFYRDMVIDNISEHWQHLPFFSSV
jgi:nicotinamide-nucleotide amidase